MSKTSNLRGWKIPLDGRDDYFPSGDEREFEIFNCTLARWEGGA